METVTPKAKRRLKRVVQRESPCGIEVAMSVLGGRWKPLIVYHLSSGTRRFGELRRLIPGVSQRMLTQQLRELERDGVVRRRVYAEVPPRVEYSLEERARDLPRILAPLNEWGRAWQRAHHARA